MNSLLLEDGTKLSFTFLHLLVFLIPVRLYLFALHSSLSHLPLHSHFAFSPSGNFLQHHVFYLRRLTFPSPLLFLCPFPSFSRPSLSYLLLFLPLLFICSFLLFSPPPSPTFSLTSFSPLSFSVSPTFQHCIPLSLFYLFSPTPPSHQPSPYIFLPFPPLSPSRDAPLSPSDQNAAADLLGQRIYKRSRCSLAIPLPLPSSSCAAANHGPLRQPKMKVFVIAVVLTAVLGAPRPQQQQATAPVYPIIPYSYQYETSDAATGNFHNKAELKTALGDVFGSWSVLMPDGFIHTTSYNVTGNSGFLPRALAFAATRVLSHCGSCAPSLFFVSFSGSRRR
ncbi:cuticular protein hypothetical 5 precursor [Penaeus vannamei]|uniref:Cuticular protein hypothetical 5 n=1 Tax=Penaeus vannamei TaxID=6689 RepID=A0A3R7PX09_PENVA|nr:cuticular protein hypothetical 5 precursor [Penaeus vannamei]